jgi:hypothetical protein
LAREFQGFETKMTEISLFPRSEKLPWKSVSDSLHGKWNRIADLGAFPQGERSG